MRLAALQWTVFVVPTLLWVKRAGWGFSQTFKLQAGTPKQLLTGLAAGPVLWLAVNAAIALRTGNAQEFAAAFAGGLPAAAAGGGAASPGMLLLGVGEGGDWGLQQGLMLLLFAAASPAGEDRSRNFCGLGYGIDQGRPGDRYHLMKTWGMCSGLGVTDCIVTLRLIFLSWRLQSRRSCCSAGCC